METKINFERLSNTIIGCAIEVHKTLGPGLLENTYKQCLAYELEKAHIKFLLEAELPIQYKGINLPCGYRIDILVENSIVVELKSVSALAPLHSAQIITYMKLSNIKTGLLINFNSTLIKEGIKRFVL